MLDRSDPFNKLSAFSTTPKPLALVVLLENVGHIHGIALPPWARQVIDFVTEEYAKTLLRLNGAYHRYDRVVLLEDADATGPKLTETLIATSASHRVDLLLLVHGQLECLVGYRGDVSIGSETFEPLLDAYRDDPSLLDLRMVYGLNCYGASLAPIWIGLGAEAVNGSAGVNWLPEPSLTIFLRDWLGGRPFSEAVAHSNATASRIGKRIWRTNASGHDHPFIASSRQAVFGLRDITIKS